MGPLDGVRVLDVSSVLAGPLACQVLGDFGADVIKVEHPRHGDSLRSHGAAKDGVPLWWTILGRNKRCIGLYLGDPEGAAVFRELARTADVVVENFRPGTLERWGLGPEVLRGDNPGLVVVRVTGFGQTGPYAGRPGFGTLAEAMSGFASITGQPDGPPTLPPFGLADAIAGLSAVIAALLGLHARGRLGVGQDVDLSILEPIVAALGPQPTVYDQLGVIQQRTGNRSGNNAPRNTYRTADGHWVAVSASANPIAERVLRLVGHPEVVAEPWFASGRGRAAHADLLDELVGGWIAARTRDQVLDAFTTAEAAVAPVYDVAELMADPQVRALDMITSVTHPQLGELAMQNVLFRMSATPGEIRFPGRELGADTDAVLGGELGIDPTRLAALRERGVVA